MLVTSRPVTAQVITNLDLNLSHEQLVRKIKVDNPTDTRILTISVEDTDPYMAKSIADEFASVASARMAEIMDSAPPNIVEEAYLPTQKTKPSITKNTMIGGLAGVFLAGAIILVLFVMNDAIKTPEDVERYLGLNTLATIPVFEGETGAKKEEIQTEEEREVSKQDAERFYCVNTISWISGQTRRLKRCVPTSCFPDMIQESLH